MVIPISDDLTGSIAECLLKKRNQLQKRAAKRAIDKLKSVYGTQYKVGRGADALCTLHFLVVLYHSLYLLHISSKLHYVASTMF